MAYLSPGVVIGVLLHLVCGAADAQSSRYGWRGFPHTPDSPPPRQWHITVHVPPVAAFQPIVIAPFPAAPLVPWSPPSITPLIQPTSPLPAITPVPGPPPPAPKISTPSSRLRSLEHQRRGDDKLRRHLWAQAYMHFRSAIDAASDLPEPRVRQGLTYALMQHYSSAVRELRRAKELDATALKDVRLASILGPGSEPVRVSLLQKVAAWAQENPQNPDGATLLVLLWSCEDSETVREFVDMPESLRAGLTSVEPGVPDLKEPPVPEGAAAGPALDLRLPPLNAEPVPLILRSP